MAIEFEIIEHLGILSTSSGGWQKELNRVSWNNGPAKFDLRSWSPDHEKMGKGITLTEEEMNQLLKILTK